MHAQPTSHAADRTRRASLGAWRDDAGETAARATGRWGPYILAAGGTAAALLVNRALNPVAPDLPPFITFYPIVFLCALAGGMGPGLLATLLTGITVAAVLLRPGGITVGEYTGLGFFVAINASISFMGGRLQVAWRNLRQRNADLAAERSRWRGVVEAIADEVWTADIHGKLSLVNMATVTALRIAAFKERSVDEVLEELEILNPDGTVRSAGDAPLLRSLHGEVVRGEEIMRHRRSGITRWREFSSAPISDGSGRIVGAVATVRDITEQKGMQEALHRSEQKLRGIFDNAGVGLVEVDGDDRIIAANDRLCRILGYQREQLLGKRIHELSHPDDRLLSDRLNADLHEGRRDRVEYEKRYLRGDGSPLGVSVTVSAVRDDQGRWLRSIGVIQDISERKAAEAALVAAKLSAEQAKQAAERASAAKGHFVAQLSHELRTPLTPVLGAVSLLEAEKDLPPIWRDTLGMIRRNVELEARLIDDLLDLTRIERGKIDLDLRPTMVCEAVERVLDTCRPDIDARRLHLGVEIIGRPLFVQADSGRLQQVLWNLIKNAAKFTPHDGCIGVRAWEEPPYIVVEVSDSGVGIAPEVLPHIFNAFEQGGAQITRQFGGLGLGLAITKRLVDLHNGSIEVHSQGVGQGARFRVRLPRAQVRAGSTTPGAKGPAASAGRLALGTPPPSALRILLVEDHGDTARIMQRILESEGHRVEHAADVATALGMALQKPYDLLISDLGLPDGSGLDLLRQLRQSGQMLPAIALSGYGMESDIAASLSAGFTEHVTKPLDLDRLAAAIARAPAPASARATGAGQETDTRDRYIRAG